MRCHIFICFLAVVYAGVIRDEGPQYEERLDHEGLIGESEHHHHVEHEHAKSHQSIKFEHFHPVPVYIKKEFSHLLKHPLEKGKHEQDLKQIHPETAHAHGYGLVLEDHRLNTDHLSIGHDFGNFQPISGGYEQGGEGLQAYADHQALNGPEEQGH